jgi:hypothetical protein
MVFSRKKLPEQLGLQDRVPTDEGVGDDVRLRRDSMLTATTNALALARFGFFHFGGRGGGSGLVLIGLVFAGVLIWAISRPGRSESAKN